MTNCKTDLDDVSIVLSPIHIENLIFYINVSVKIETFVACKGLNTNNAFHLEQCAIFQAIFFSLFRLSWHLSQRHLLATRASTVNDLPQSTHSAVLILGAFWAFIQALQSPLLPSVYRSSLPHWVHLKIFLPLCNSYS